MRTHYSFLRGASHPSELVERSAELGLSALAITDRDGVYGVPKAFAAWKGLSDTTRLKLITGAELTLGENLPRLTLLAQNRAGYALLCRLLSASHEGKPKGEASLEWVRFQGFMESSDFERGREGLVVLPEEGLASRELLEELTGYFSGRIYLPLSRTLDGRDRKRGSRIITLGRELGLPIVATNEVHMHLPERRRLQDALTAIRENVSLDQAGLQIFSNGERYLKSPDQMSALFEDLPEALWNTIKIAERCTFCPSELRYRYPSEWIPAGESAQAYLRRLTLEGARKRYQGLIPDDVLRQLENEFKLVQELQYADYFLTIWEIVEFARSRKILCQGRGSAANSAICYCLGITAVDPVRMSLLFERFLSAERGEPPDIDVDFEHERREEVIQHIYEKYGRDRAGMVAAVITYRTRSSLRDVAKALGMEPEAASLNPHAKKLMEELHGFPRHLSIHSGGFTLSADPLIDTVPIEPARMEGRTIVQWDKVDLAAIGLLKVDILALGMLTAIRKCLDRVGLELHEVPQEDPKTYQMICRGDTVGVFQIESRAQIGMLKRLLPRTFYDLVIQVAIVRPGPIVGEMVHPYLKRRRGLESSRSPDPRLEPILGRTLGVPLFQEQVMKMAITMAGFSGGEADELRRAIGAWRSTGSIERLGKKLMKGLLESGLPAEFVQRIFKQIQGFAEYGFPESHAASFALLAYVSSYLKCHHPAEFAWALLNSQPMGFYSSHTLIDEVKRVGVPVLPLEPNRSEWDFTLERVDTGPMSSRFGIRVGWRAVQGLGEVDCAKILEERRLNGPFRNLGDFIYRVRLRPQTLERLAMGEAFACFGLSQRQSLWEILAYRSLAASESEKKLLGEQFNFFEEQPQKELESTRERGAYWNGGGQRAHFLALSETEAIRADYDSYGLSVRGHPMGALRKIASLKLPRITSGGVKRTPGGRMLKVAGLVIVRQRPPTAKGTAFATLEDEEGFLDLIIHKNIFEKYEEVFVGNAFLLVSGRVQIDQLSVSLIVRKIEALQTGPMDLGSIRVQGYDFH
jgi:error-prone DNA polymerase